MGLGEVFASNEVFVTVKSDQSGILRLEFSDDFDETDANSNWETESYNVDANAYKSVNAFKARRKFRVQFENNSGSNQTFLRLNTYYGAFESVRSSTPTDVTTIVDKIDVSSSTSTLLLAANRGRIYIAISTQEQPIWLKLQAASVDNDKKGIFIPRNFTYELHPDVIYTGEVSAITDTGTAEVYVTEF